MPRKQQFELSRTVYIYIQDARSPGTHAQRRRRLCAQAVHPRHARHRGQGCLQGAPDRERGDLRVAATHL